LADLLIGILAQQLPHRFGHLRVVAAQQLHQAVAVLGGQQLLFKQLGEEARHVVDELAQEAGQRVSGQCFQQGWDEPDGVLGDIARQRGREQPAADRLPALGLDLFAFGDQRHG
jgi:hypothetical protein